MIERRQIFGRSEWLAWRKSYLTASDIGAAAGLDEYKVRLRLFAEKRGTVPDIVETGAMRRGRLFESAALAYLQEMHPLWEITGRRRSSPTTPTGWPARRTPSPMPMAPS